MSPETNTKSMPTKPNKGGAPTGNRNRMTHGCRGWLTIGSLPKGASYVRRVVGEFRRQIETAVLAVHGELSPYGSALAQSAARHEARALLAGRWLNREGEALPLAEKLALLKSVADATDSRDRCLEKLGLNRMPTLANPWEALNQPHSVNLPVADAATAETIAEPDADCEESQ